MDDYCYNCPFQAFTVAKRTLEGQDMIYQSLKLSNGIWGLVEIKLCPGNPNITLSFKSRVMEIAQAVFQARFWIFETTSDICFSGL